MRTAAIHAAALGLLLASSPALAEAPVYTLGSFLGLDVYNREHSSVVILSTSPASPWLLPVVPGLRIGMVLPRERVEIAAVLGTTVIANEGSSVTSVGGTLEGNYAFAGDEVVRPYVGMHLGLTRLGDSEGDSGHLSDLGVQLGVRRMVSSGHGAVRLELRGSVIGDGESESMKNLGVRVGYDLWFR
jgi:hypothetical protein